MLYQYLKENHQKILHWGLGFIQVRVNDDVNYHFYTDKISANFDCETPHNHRRSFISEILAGVLQEKVLFVKEGGSLALTSNLCSVSEFGGYVRITSVDNNTYKKGDKYLRTPYEYHTVSSSNCVTRLEKFGDEHEVYSLGETEPVEIVKYDEDFLWGIVEEMCNEHSL